MSQPQNAPRNATPDSTIAGQGVIHPYDSIWTGTSVPEKQPDALERVMLSEDKLFVVLVVVLLIWFGVLAFLFRTDRRITALEKSIRDNEERRS